jgi:putative ATPase
MNWYSRGKCEERTSFTYKDITIKVIKNDITSEKSDCIVNAANEHLAHGGGVAGAISSQGGPEVQRESSEYVRKHGIVLTGQVAVTGPGRLSCKKIIHAVGPVYRNGRSGEDEELESAIMNSFKAANDLGYTSISIPAISSGIFGYPKPRCAKVMIRTTRNFIESVQGTRYSLIEIRLTNFDEETTGLMEQELEKFKSNPDQEIILDPTAKRGWGRSPESSTSKLTSSWEPFSKKSIDPSNKLGQSEISRKFDDEKEDSQGKMKNEALEPNLMELDKLEEMKTEEIHSKDSSKSESKPFEVAPDSLDCEKKSLSQQIDPKTHPKDLKETPTTETKEEKQENSEDHIKNTKNLS